MITTIFIADNYEKKHNNSFNSVAVLCFYS